MSFTVAVIFLLLPAALLALWTLRGGTWKRRWVRLGCTLWVVVLAFIALRRGLILLVGLLLVLLLPLLAPPKNNWDHDLVELSNGLDYRGTRFEFRYGRRTRTMHDPYDNFRWIYGDTPDDIYVENGTRVVVYRRRRAIIKSENDSIDVGLDHVHHKGYMGIWSDAITVRADEEGVIHEVN